MTGSAANTRLTENLGPFAFGVGVATFAIAAPFMAVAVGLIEAEEPIHWALRAFLVLFTLPFLFIGGALMLGGFVTLVNAAVPGNSPAVVRAPLYVLRQVANPRHWLAALPVGFIVLQYYLVARNGVGLFGVSAAFLQRGILLEFLAIHATGFLGVATLIPPTSRRLRVARFATLAALSLLYLAMGSAEGWDAALFLAYLIAIKFGPLLFSPPDLHTGASLGLRWGFHMVVFLSVFTFFGGFESFRAGAIYWSAITVAELLGMTDAEIFEKPDTIVRPDNI